MYSNCINQALSSSKIRFWGLLILFLILLIIGFTLYESLFQPDKETTLESLGRYIYLIKFHYKDNRNTNLFMDIDRNTLKQLAINLSTFLKRDETKQNEEILFRTVPEIKKVMDSGKQEIRPYYGLCFIILIIISFIVVIVVIMFMYCCNKRMKSKSDKTYKKSCEIDREQIQVKYDKLNKWPLSQLLNKSLDSLDSVIKWIKDQDKNQIIDPNIIVKNLDHIYEELWSKLAEPLQKFSNEYYFAIVKNRNKNIKALANFAFVRIRGCNDESEKNAQNNSEHGLIYEGFSFYDPEEKNQDILYWKTKTLCIDLFHFYSTIDHLLILFRSANDNVIKFSNVRAQNKIASNFGELRFLLRKEHKNNFDFEGFFWDVINEDDIKYVEKEVRLFNIDEKNLKSGAKPDEIKKKIEYLFGIAQKPINDIENQKEQDSRSTALNKITEISYSSKELYDQITQSYDYFQVEELRRQFSIPTKECSEKN